MRIALVARQLATLPHSGLNRATCDLAHGLFDLGHTVHVVAEAAHDGLGLPEGVVVHDVSGGRPLTWAASVQGRLARLHAGGELDLASVPLWGSTGIFATRDPRFPTVVSCMTSATTIGEIDPAWAAVEESRDAVRLERTCVEGARHLHGLTRASLDKTLADYGGSPLTSAVVPRGLRDRAIATSPNGRDGGVDVLFVGRLEARKGVDLLLEAVTALIGEGLDVRLTLAGPDVALADGSGTYRERFVARASAAVAERVRFAGPVSDARLHELYAAADVVCQPSRYESHGIVLVEAMMFGAPIVTTSGGGIPEVVEEGGNALLAEPGDSASLARALRAVVESEPLRRRLAARSRELYLERFEIGVVARAMTELFADAIRAHAAAPPDTSAAALLACALDERSAAGEALRVRAEAAEAERDALWSRAEAADAERERLGARAQAAESERDELRERATQAERARDDWREQAEIANGRLWELTRSRSWRLTRPLRRAARIGRRG